MYYCEKSTHGKKLGPARDQSLEYEVEGIPIECATVINKSDFKAESHVIIMKTLIISTYKRGIRDGPIKDHYDGDKLVVSVKQANLLALTLLPAIAEIGSSKIPQLLPMTPLCGAIFNKSDLDDLATALNMTILDTLNMVNASSQSGGQYLDESDMACAIVCALSATVRVKDSVRIQIVQKTVKQYQAAKKPFNREVFFACAKHATGGVGKGFEFDVLLEMFDNAKKRSQGCLDSK